METLPKYIHNMGEIKNLQPERISLALWKELPCSLSPCPWHLARVRWILESFVPVESVGISVLVCMVTCSERRTFPPCVLSVHASK